MSSLDTLFTCLSRLCFSLFSSMTWPPDCFFDSPAYIDTLMCASAAKKAYKLQKASKLQASRSTYNPGQGETAPLAPLKSALSLSAPGPDVPTPTAPPAEPPAPPSDPPDEALVLNQLVQVVPTALKSRGLALEQIWTTGACTEADSGSVGPPAPPCSPYTKALTLAHQNSDVCVGGVGGAGGGAGGGREVGGGTLQRRAGPAEKGTWKYCHNLLPSDAYPGLLGGFYSYTESENWRRTVVRGQSLDAFSSGSKSALGRAKVCAGRMLSAGKNSWSRGRQVAVGGIETAFRLEFIGKCRHLRLPSPEIETRATISEGLINLSRTTKPNVKWMSGYSRKADKIGGKPSWGTATLAICA
ncbi:hypothetical protein FB451DRAFT_1370613 [Mycena latifolia]|nr:hypothetical protein FB451DRAFT_1370613 [Mycena latifolia]